MTIIIGLGNPGKKFGKTRHNVGFRVVEEFQRKNNFPDFKISEKFLSEISGGILNEEKIILAKPQAFMNESGKAAKLLIKNLKSKTKNYIIVTHDDADLPVGKIKIVKNRGPAGHKGVESIIKNIGNKNLIRFRIGIRPQNASDKKQDTKAFVLKKFSKEEEEIIDQTAQKTADALNLFIRERLEKTMSAYNK